jgi:hypothetical protein
MNILSEYRNMLFHQQLLLYEFNGRFINRKIMQRQVVHDKLNNAQWCGGGVY